MKTTSDKSPFFALAVTLSAVVASASVYLYVVNHDHPPQYLMAIAVIFFAWTMRQFFGVCAEKGSAIGAGQRDVTLGIVFACLLLGIGLVARQGWIGEEFRLRSIGFFTGMFVILLANVIPKRTGSACILAIRRAVAWTAVLGGLGYTLAWLMLPLAYASEVATSIMVFAMVYAMGRAVWLIRKYKSKPPSTPE